jgi:hypothetical protein
MSIPAQNPTVIPSVSEKTFSDLWLYNINIHSPSINSGRIHIEAIPYNPDSQEIGPSSGLEVISTDLLFQAVYDVPEVGLAYQAIIDAIVPLREWIAVQNAPKPPVIDPVVVDTVIDAPIDLVVVDSVFVDPVVVDPVEPSIITDPVEPLVASDETETPA